MPRPRSVCCGSRIVGPLEDSPCPVRREGGAVTPPCGPTSPLKGSLDRLEDHELKKSSSSRKAFSEYLLNELMTSKMAARRGQCLVGFMSSNVCRCWSLNPVPTSCLQRAGKLWPQRSSFRGRCPCAQQSVLQNPATSQHPEEAKAPSVEGVLCG